MKGLHGKRVLITGGAGAIGTATAKRFAEEGAHVHVFDRDEAACRRLTKDMPDLAGYILVDVADPDSVARAFHRAGRSGGRTGYPHQQRRDQHPPLVLDITPQEWRTVLDINLNGVFYVAQQSARRMLAQGGGVIVNMGSSNGLTGYHYYADYNASKAGVIELSRSMALELATDHPRQRGLSRVHHDADAGSRVHGRHAEGF